MKYEIIKGSGKDFEGVPVNVLTLYRFAGHIDLHGSLLPSIYTHISGKTETIAERRPISEPVWDGEGLPPVGVECEILWNDDWVKCVVKAYGKEQLIFKAEGSREWAGHIKNYKFRPIRSPEDVARNEAIDSIQAKLLLRREVAIDFYDAIAAGEITGVKLEGK